MSEVISNCCVAFGCRLSTRVTLHCTSSGGSRQRLLRVGKLRAAENNTGNFVHLMNFLTWRSETILPYQFSTISPLGIVHAIGVFLLFENLV